MKVLIVGDLHGDNKWFNTILINALHADKDIELTLQVGDFGIWSGDEGDQFLESLNKTLERAKMELWFIDGNHEDFEKLSKIRKYDHTLKNSNGIAPLQGYEYISHICRGHVFSLGSKVFMGVGGAISIDKNIRDPYISWWPEEDLTDEEYERSIDNAEKFTPDIFLTHDGPSNIPFDLVEDVQSGIFRQRLSDISAAGRPHRWFHGHHHQFVEYKFPVVDPYTYVTGLAANRRNRSWVIYDTEEDIVFIPQEGL